MKETRAERRLDRKRQIERQQEMTIIVRTITRSLLPVVLVFAIYIVTYGHLTPGGGFQGGMILVGAVMSFYLAYGYHVARRFRDEDLDLIEHLGAFVYLLVGLVALAIGRPFLQNILHGGPAGALLSGGIVPVLNFTVGFKVAAGTLVVLLILLEALQKGEK